MFIFSPSAGSSVVIEDKPIPEILPGFEKVGPLPEKARMYGRQPHWAELPAEETLKQMFDTYLSDEHEQS